MNLLNLSLKILGKENEGSFGIKYRWTLQKVAIFSNFDQHDSYCLWDFRVILYFDTYFDNIIHAIGI